MNANIAARLLERAEDHPEREAIVSLRGRHRRAVTFGELADYVCGESARLRGADVKRGARVLLLVPMSIELYVTLLGVLHAGAVAVFVDAWAGRARIDAAIRAANPALAIGGWKPLLLRLFSPALRRVPLRSPDLAATGPARGSREPLHAASVAPGHPALVTFTTGSTGAPKGAERSHGFLWSQHRALADHLDLRPGEADLPTLPIFVLNNLALGVTSVIPDFDPRRPARIDPARIARQIVDERVATASGSPAFFARLCDWALERGATLPLRGVWTGGAPVHPALARRLSDAIAGDVHVVYGSTEAEPIAGISAEELVRLGSGKAPGLCVGRPVPELDVRLIDPTDGPIELGSAGWREWEVAPGEVGEVVVTGPHVLGAYLDAPEETRRAKIADGSRIWHRTGDAARMDGDGRIWLMGRVSQRIERAGERLWPIPIETAVLDLPGIVHAALVGVADSRIGQSAVLCVEAERGAGRIPTEAEIRRAVDPAPVDRIVRLRHIPRDPRHASKTDHAALLKRIG